ncbi:MAG: NADH-quinone oxidoreductase subunit [Thermoleophilaceae bacterium]|nr:NADH-quinone oxidoreductase subunit [Thermoleophilaceae bacterium]
MARPEPNWISFEIDGKQVRAPEGAMLVDAAKEGDVEIPYFCYEPKLGQPVGACRMCLVEIEGIPKLQTSCSTPVRDGMVVNTTSDRVKNAQNAVVEFLLVNHPLDCPVCDKGGECPLQDISYGWGAGRSRFIDPKRHFKKPLELSPLVAIDRERCILCYRCVRFSQEVAEDYQLVFLERGDHTFVGTHDGRPYVAPFSGNIIELCPVGALTSSAYRFRARPWDIEGSGTICTMCPSQCNVELTVRDDAKVVRVLARDNEEVDDGWLCDKGRFGYQAFGSPERITAPLVRDGGFLREVSWERALGEAARLLERSGERTAALVGGFATNEEGFLVQHLLRQGLGSPNVDSRVAGRLSGEHARALARPQLGAKVSDIDHADAILVLDAELVEEAPILDLRVRKAVRRNHARLVVASSRPSTLDRNASAALRFAPGTAEAALGALAAALGSPRASGSLDELAAKARASAGFRPGTPAAANGNGAAMSAPAGEAAADPPTSAADAVRAVADVLRDAGDIVVIWGERVAGGERGGQAVEALLALAESLGVEGKDESGLIEVPAGTNGRGLREVGCAPTLAPGLADAPAEGMTAAEIAEADELGTVLLFESSLPAPALDRAGGVVAFAHFHGDELDEHADVVFPAAVYAEKEGTVTHPDGRLQRVRQALGHPNEARAGWWVLAELCERTGAGLGVLSAPMVTEALTEAVPFYAGITLDEIGGQGVRWQERDAASALAGSEPSTEQLAGAPSAPEGLRVAAAPSFWGGYETAHAPSLRFLATDPRVELSVADARAAGIESGDEVRLSAGGESVVVVVAVRTGVPAGSLFLSGAVLPDAPVEIAVAVVAAGAVDA